MILGPLFYLLPPLLVFAAPHAHWGGLAEIYILLGPLSCAFWMLVSCHWQRVRKAQRDGRLDTWRESEGEMLRTVAKATLYMFAGLFGSFLCEIGLALIFRLDPRSEYNQAIWFAMLPFATFAPVLLLWLIRRMRGTKNLGNSSVMSN